MPTRFARPPHHQQGKKEKLNYKKVSYNTLTTFMHFSFVNAGMRVGVVPYGSRQQTSPLGSPQPLPSPGNPSNELAVSLFTHIK